MHWIQLLYTRVHHNFTSSSDACIVIFFYIMIHYTHVVVFIIKKFEFIRRWINQWLKNTNIFCYIFKINEKINEFIFFRNGYYNISFVYLFSSNRFSREIIRFYAIFTFILKTLWHWVFIEWNAKLSSYKQQTIWRFLKMFFLLHTPKICVYICFKFVHTKCRSGSSSWK